MRNDLFPYYSTDKKAFFNDNGKKIIIELVSENEVNWIGGKTKKTLQWPVNFRPNLSMLKINYDSK